MPSIPARWIARLECECPACQESVDLLESPDFWDGRGKLEIAEHDTPASTNMPVDCPLCGHLFTVDCEW